MASDTAEELERFRQRWQEEVSTRKKPTGATASSSRSKSKQPNDTLPPPLKDRPHLQPDRSLKEARTELEGRDLGYHDLENKDDALRLGESGSGIRSKPRPEPQSALEHYERAVERESEGSLGESLSLYRKAYRLDAAVDKAYKNKHFPQIPSAPKPQSGLPEQSDTSKAASKKSNHDTTVPGIPISNLIASFAHLSIPPEPPSTDASPAPPCPIANIPSEILAQILFQLGVSDPASLSRFALVCKRFAYLVATEEAVWRRICNGYEYGFAAMHYTWQCTISCQPLPSSIDEFDDRISTLAHSISPPILPLSPTYSSYRAMMYSRPRIRFHGCYISTCNYIRPGQATALHATWQNPVLIVTYYRYLRFFRDGSCVTLLTTAEPIDVVHHLTKENMQTKQHPAGLPTAVMNQALKGRWRLSGDPFGKKRAARSRGRIIRSGSITQNMTSHSRTEPTLQEIKHKKNADEHLEPMKNEHDAKKEDGKKYDDIQAVKEEEEEVEEGVLHIETEGADAGASNPKYMYKIMLKLQHAGGTTTTTNNHSNKVSGPIPGLTGGGKTRNNKLAWMGYWSYNRLTDDWSEFGLRNDKAFFWSRVKSYGDGE